MPVTTAKPKGASLGERVVSLRKAKDWTQFDLAAASDLSLSTVQQVELDNADPRGSTLVSLARALDTSAGALLGEG